MASLAEGFVYNFDFTPCELTNFASDLLAFDPQLFDLTQYPVSDPTPAPAPSQMQVPMPPVTSSSSVLPEPMSRAAPVPAPSGPPPIRTHGTLLLPKIRSQDQVTDPTAITPPPPKRAKRKSSSASASVSRSSSTGPLYSTPARRPGRSSAHAPSQSISSEPMTCPVPRPFTPELPSESLRRSPSYLAAPLPRSASHSRNVSSASSCSVDSNHVDPYGFGTYRPVSPFTPRTSVSPPPQPQQLFGHQKQQQQQSTQLLHATDGLLFQPFTPRAPSPLAYSDAAAPAEPSIATNTPTTTLISYLTAPNPATSLVRTITIPLRDLQTKHYWWDIRQVRPWKDFNAETILGLPGAAQVLSCPIPEALLPANVPVARHPETEQVLYAIHASHYVARINAALALSSTRSLKITPPSKPSSIAAPNASSGMQTDCMFVANMAGEAASAATIFGGRPMARVIGLVKSYDRFNSGMRVEGNIKRVEYLRALSHLHYAMREHSCRYGFILTEIELVVVRNGSETTPHFGFIEVASVRLAMTAAVAAGDGTSSGASVGADDAASTRENQVPLTVCLALWGLCMMAADEVPAGQVHYRSEIGAPAEGTRRKALPREPWIPQPQLAEKRQAKRARGWVWPEDPIGRKEMGKRGVKYGGC